MASNVSHHFCRRRRHRRHRRRCRSNSRIAFVAYVRVCMESGSFFCFDGATCDRCMLLVYKHRHRYSLALAIFLSHFYPYIYFAAASVALAKHCYFGSRTMCVVCFPTFSKTISIRILVDTYFLVVRVSCCSSICHEPV